MSDSSESTSPTFTLLAHSSPVHAPLQSDLQPFELQIGGKHHAQKSSAANPWAKRFLHSRSSEFVFKPVTEGHRGHVEVGFYSAAFPHVAISADNEAVQQKELLGRVSFCQSLLQFLPTFHGMVSVDADGTCNQYICLSDVTSAFSHPCVVDLKIGTQTYDDFASPQKKASETSKFPDQAVMGFRFTGMKVFDPATQSYTEFNKTFCHSLDASSYMNGFRAFFQFADPQVLVELVVQLRLLLHVFETHNQHRFISSSLLLVYGGRSVSEMNQFSCAQCSDYDMPRPREGGCSARAHMIDFGHVTTLPEPQRDDGYIRGLRTIIAALEQLQHEACAK
jgi:hypothetical protein